jgi:hypothetical protein
MRKSEEYIENNPWDDTTIKIKDAKHAVDLAYKEGYLKAITDILKLSDKTLDPYVKGDVLDFLIELRKLKNKMN